MVGRVSDRTGILKKKSESDVGMKQNSIIARRHNCPSCSDIHA
jgi:hypothetical protein